jgi:hypothetical protein
LRVSVPLKVSVTATGVVVVGDVTVSLLLHAAADRATASIAANLNRLIGLLEAPHIMGVS